MNDTEKKKNPRKITTLSYFKYRMKNSGYTVWDIFDKYTDIDPRKWTILIDPSCYAIFCTCYENLEEEGDVFFEFHDGGQYLPFRFRIKTDSFEVITEHLNSYNVLNKHESYCDKKS